MMKQIKIMAKIVLFVLSVLLSSCRFGGDIGTGRLKQMPILHLTLQNSCGKGAFEDAYIDLGEFRWQVGNLSEGKTASYLFYEHPIPEVACVGYTLIGGRHVERPFNMDDALGQLSRMDGPVSIVFVVREEPNGIQVRVIEGVAL